MNNDTNSSNWPIGMLLLLMILFHDVFKGGYTEMTDLKETFVNIIKNRLSDPNITANDIKVLAEAYSELTRNDWLKDAYNKLGSNYILGCSSINKANESAQLIDLDAKGSPESGN